jgi:hypothetical protein
MKRSKLFMIMWFASLMTLLVCSGVWAGPFDSLTDRVKGAIKTQVDETAGKTEADVQNRDIPGRTEDASKKAEKTIRGHEPGNIVFSTSPISTENPSKLVNSFKAGESIYALAYLEKSIRNLSSAPQTKKVYVEISFWNRQKPLYSYQQPSEQFIGYSAANLSGSLLEKNVLPFEILPTAEKMTSYSNPEMDYKKFGKKSDGPVKIAESLSKLGAGQHTIIFKIKINYKDVSQGDFLIEGEDFSKLLALAENYRKGEATQSKAGAEMPKAAMKNKKLEAEMTEALKASRTYNDRMKGQILRLVIIDPEWMIRRNELTGVILHRYIRAAAAIRDSGGECRVWNLITFQQDYVGGRFQKTRFDGVGDPVSILCEKVK